MEQPHAATRDPDPEAVEFIRFCYARRRVGWPELYDEMCAVAARGLFRGLGSDDLAAHGIGFSLFDMPALAAMANGIVAQEQARRRPVTVVIRAAADDEEAAAVAVGAETVALPAVPSPARPATSTSPSTQVPGGDDRATTDGGRHARTRFAPVTAGA